MPVHTVPSRHRAERHHLRVSDQPTRQTPRQRALERRMVLQEAAVAVVAHHPAPRPHQHGAPSRHLQVADLPVAAVMHPVAAEPALRAAQPQQRGLDAHPERSRRVLEHLQHADLRQVQPNCHSIGSHRGPPGSLISQSPIPAGPRPLLRDPQPPRSPHFREGSTSWRTAHEPRRFACGCPKMWSCALTRCDARDPGAYVSRSVPVPGVVGALGCALWTLEGP